MDRIDRTYRNLHGRQWGRGIRPYLLLPKVVVVGTFGGGLVTVLVLGFAAPAPDSPDAWRAQADVISRAYVHVIVPALLGTLLMGMCLASTHFHAFIRMRWFQVKLLLVAVCVPALHLYMRGRSLALKGALQAPADLAAAAVARRQMLAGTIATLVFALVIVFLGRVKPRLGQDYGRTFTRGRLPDGRAGDDTSSK